MIPDGAHVVDELAVRSHAHVIVDMVEHSVDMYSRLCEVLAALKERAHTEHIGAADTEDGRLWGRGRHHLLLHGRCHSR